MFSTLKLASACVPPTQPADLSVGPAKHVPARRARFIWRRCFFIVHEFWSLCVSKAAMRD